MHGKPFLHVLISNRECRDTEEVEGGGWTGTRRQFAVVVVCSVGLISNYRRRSANYRHLRSSAFFNMTPPLSSYGDGDDDGDGGGGSQQRNSAGGPADVVFRPMGRCSVYRHRSFQFSHLNR